MWSVYCEELGEKIDRVLLTHWGRATHICVSKLTIIGSDNGLSPGRHQANIWINDGVLLIWPLLGTNFSEIFSKIHSFPFKKMHLKTSSAKWRPFCLGLNVLMAAQCITFPNEEEQNFRVKSVAVITRCNKTWECIHYCSERGRTSTHWGRDKMAAVSQTTLLNAFSLMKMLEFRLRIHWSLFLRVQLTIFQHWFRYGLAPVRRQAIILTNDG